MPRLSAPGNLLLAGEYAIVEEGGLGICVAPNRRAYLEIEPNPRWEVIFHFQGQTQHWNGNTAQPALLQSIEHVLGPLPPARLNLDTNAFSPQGRKLGLGSSAASAVLLTAGFLALLRKEKPSLGELASLATAVHRHFQGGRGSGYDVLTSAHGGLGLFVGGPTPQFHPITLPWLKRFALIAGLEAVSTQKAVNAYQELKNREPQTVNAYFFANNNLIQRLVECTSWEVAHPLLLALAQKARDLGQKLHRPAELLPELEGFSFAKALGAGDELFMVMDDDETLLQAGLQPVELAREGLRWE